MLTDGFSKKQAREHLSFAIGVAAVVALPSVAPFVDAKLGLVAADVVFGVCLGQAQGHQGIAQALWPVAIHHTVGQVGAVEGLSQQGVNGDSRVRTVALQAIGHPRQVESGEQRVLVEGMVGQGHGVQAGVVEQQVAVNRGEQRGGVGNHPVGLRLCFCLRLRCRALLVCLEGAALAFAPCAQGLIYPLHAGWVDSVGCHAGDGLGQGLSQAGFAGAFGAQDGDTARRPRLA